MALINSNVLTPQQAALNSKKSTNPLLKLASGVASTIFPAASGAIQAGTAAYNAMQPKPAPVVNLPSISTNAPAAKPVNAGLLASPVPQAATKTPVNATVQPAVQPQQPAQYAAAATQPPPGTANGTLSTDAGTSAATNTSLIGRIFEELLARGKQASTAADDVSKAAASNAALGQKAQAIADAAGQEFASIGKKGAAAETGYLTTGTTPVAEGNAAVVARTAAAQQQAVAQGAQTQLSGVDKQLAAANQAATGFASAGNLAKGALDSAGNIASPIQQPYGNMLVDPVTGQPIQQGAGTLNDAVALQVQRVKNGTAGYNDAVSALGAYGQAGINALQQALGPTFNIAQSNTLAGQQGSIGPALGFATTALDNLDTAAQQLSSLQKTNSPAINAISNWGSFVTGLGSEQTRAYVQATQEARNAYASVLASVRGGTPTDYSGQAQAAIPDHPTPNDIAAAKATLVALGQAKQDIYGNPGAYNNTPLPTTGFNW